MQPLHKLLSHLTIIPFVDEETLPRDQQPLVAISLVEDYQEGYPQIWVEDQEVGVLCRFVRLC